MRMASLAFGVSLFMIGCGGDASSPVAPSPADPENPTAVSPPAVRITHFPDKPKPAESLECAGEIFIPKTLETRHSPRLYLLRDGASVDQSFIEEVPSGSTGRLPFSHEVTAPREPGKYTLLVTVAVVEREVAEDGSSTSTTEQRSIESEPVEFEVVLP